MKTAPDEVRVVSVGRVANYVQRLLRQNSNLRYIGVRGEISGFKTSANGWVNFVLKDEEAVLECVVWSKYSAGLPPLENGKAVIAYGSFDAYVKRSRYELVVTSVVLEGVGDLHAEFEKLKRKLEAEGAFAPERKRRVTRFPFRVALVSSRTADGMRDFMKIVSAQSPQVAITLVETPVQGVGAAIEIADAIDRASRMEVDAIVIVRGGGSFEDLFPFSTETVARAILRAAHPVVTGIGHEYDRSIADMVADVEAKTPSDAAHVVIPKRDDLLAHIARATKAMEGRAVGRVRLATHEYERAAANAERAVTLVLRRSGQRVVALERRLDRFDPSRRLADRGKALELKRFRLERAVQERLVRARERWERVQAEFDPAVRAGHHARILRIQFVQAKLEGNNPEKILQQGYAIVRYDGAVVRDPEAVPQGAQIRAQVAHGTLVARVEAREADGAE